MHFLLYIFLLIHSFPATHSRPNYEGSERLKRKLEAAIGDAVPSNPKFLQFAWDALKEDHSGENKVMMPVKVLKVETSNRLNYRLEVEYGEANCENNIAGKTCVLRGDGQRDVYIVGVDAISGYPDPIEIWIIRKNERS